MQKRCLFQFLITALFLLVPFVEVSFADEEASSSGHFPGAPGKPENKTGDIKKEKRWSLEYELDAYYSNAGLYLQLTDQPIPDAGELGEFDVYKNLLYSSYIPRFLVLEAAVFPMPNLGAFLKDGAEGFYNGAQVSNDLNLIKAITAGFQEPYALSLFMGNVVSFSRPGEERKQGNFGYMGYLISIGDKHIKDNDLIEDAWVEAEWKIKGDRRFSTHTLLWSFRAGGKFHENPDITDIYYLGVRRNRVDFESVDSLLYNSGIEYKVDFDKKTLEPIRHYFTVDKNWPVSSLRFGVALSLGFVWESLKTYSGELQDRRSDKFEVIIRPNLIF